MSWILTVPLLLFARIVAPLPLASLARRPTSALQLVAEAFLAGLAVVALVWLAWVALCSLSNAGERSQSSNPGPGSRRRRRSGQR